MQMPEPDAKVIADRERLVEVLREIVPGDGVIADKEALRVYESDGLTAYHQPPLLAVLPETTAQVALVLKAHMRIKIIEVQGHTDDRGNDKKNKRLSELRAKAVRSYLIKKGVSKERLIAEGYGEEQPIDSNKTEMGRANNRRVEFVILQQD